MSFLEAVLRSKQAKEAILQGWETAVSTGSLSKGVDAVVATANKNGSLPAAKIAFWLDVLTGK